MKLFKSIKKNIGFQVVIWRFWDSKLLFFHQKVTKNLGFVMISPHFASLMSPCTRVEHVLLIFRWLSWAPLVSAIECKMCGFMRSKSANFTKFFHLNHLELVKNTNESELLDNFGNHWSQLSCDGDFACNGSEFDCPVGYGQCFLGFPNLDKNNFGKLQKN